MQKHELPKLPYEYNDLEPFIDEQTMRIHHTKHHQAYIDKLNSALEKFPELQGKNAEDLLKKLDQVPEEIRTAVRNHGGGHYNHSLFWQMMKPKAEGKPMGELAKAIDKELNGFDEFRKKFSETAMNRFGSGWAWLTANRGKLEVYSTANQDSPVSEGKSPVLGIDLWEHAYYLKYQNKRADYVQAFFSVINWEKAEELYKKAIK